jgi:hypothetical protein
MFYRVASAYCMEFKEDRLILFSRRLTGSGQQEPLGGDRMVTVSCVLHSVHYNSIVAFQTNKCT